MNKRDLVYVLVIMTGFSTLVFAVVLAVSAVVTTITYQVQQKALDYGLMRSLTDFVIRAIVSILVIRKADPITSWLLREPKTNARPS